VTKKNFVQPELARAEGLAASAVHQPATGHDTTHVVSPTTTDWRQGALTLASTGVTLRPLQVEDAASLMTMLASREVARFISPPPATLEGFARFVEWAQASRAKGEYICFGIVPAGCTMAVGLFQVRALEPSFRTAEWGFAIGSEYWGSGVFNEGAELVLDFVFNVMGVHRLEARAAIGNGRGNGALRKVGAVQEGVLRRALLCHGVYHDQTLWSMLAEDWHAQKLGCTVQVH